MTEQTIRFEQTAASKYRDGQTALNRLDLSLCGRPRLRVAVVAPRPGRNDKIRNCLSSEKLKGRISASAYESAGMAGRG